MIESILTNNSFTGIINIEGSTLDLENGCDIKTDQGYIALRKLYYSDLYFTIRAISKSGGKTELDKILDKTFKAKYYLFIYNDSTWYLIDCQKLWKTSEFKKQKNNIKYNTKANDGTARIELSIIKCANAIINTNNKNFNPKSTLKRFIYGNL